MPMHIHNPIAIQKYAFILLRYYEYPKPIRANFITDSRDWDRSDLEEFLYQEALEKWQSSFKEVPFKDQENITWICLCIECNRLNCKPENMPQDWKLETVLNSGIPLDSIAGRIEIVDGFAIIKPEEEQESQEDLWQDVLILVSENSEDFIENKLQQLFEIRRKK